MNIPVALRLLCLYSCLLLRYASQNSLDESSQKHIPRENGKDKPPYRNHHHTNRAFDVINEMRKYVTALKGRCVRIVLSDVSTAEDFNNIPFFFQEKLTLRCHPGGGQRHGSARSQDGPRRVQSLLLRDVHELRGARSGKDNAAGRRLLGAGVAGGLRLLRRGPRHGGQRAGAPTCRESLAADGRAGRLLRFPAGSIASLQLPRYQGVCRSARMPRVAGARGQLHRAALLVRPIPRVQLY